MIDRRLVGALLVVAGLAAGWFLRALVAPAHVVPATGAGRAPVAPNAPVVGAEDVGSGLTTEARAAAFEGIYKDATWGTNLGSAGTSGFGSMVKTTVVYRAFLETFIKDNNIKSVVDAGCGDWEFSHAIDWNGIDYKGYDIVPKVVEYDNQHFAKPNIQFFAGDIVAADLPPADLLISKDVLQHLPNADVQKFLAKQLPKYKHVLLVDGTTNATLTAVNRDITIGDYRPLDLTRAPFRIGGFKILTYWDGMYMHQVLYVQAVAPAAPAPN